MYVVMILAVKVHREVAAMHEVPLYKSPDYIDAGKLSIFITIDFHTHVWLKSEVL